MIVAASNITIDLNGFAILKSPCHGIEISGLTKVRVTNGSVINNLCNGINASGDHLVLDRLVVSNNSSRGIFLVAATDSRLVLNTADSNVEGIHLFGGADRNLLVANNASNNTSLGILIDSFAEDNKLVANMASGNAAFDLFDVSSDCDNNLWKGNKFGTANQGCIQ